MINSLLLIFQVNCHVFLLFEITYLIFSFFNLTVTNVFSVQLRNCYLHNSHWKGLFVNITQLVGEHLLKNSVDTTTWLLDNQAQRKVQQSKVYWKCKINNLIYSVWFLLLVFFNSLQAKASFIFSKFNV